MPERLVPTTVAANSASTLRSSFNSEWRATKAVDQACDDDGLTRVRDSGGHRVPNVAIAQQIGCNRCSYHPDDNSPPSRRTKGDQNP
jgi:hypothetical protein